MPFTVNDVDSHKKGLTDKQKKQWVRISNAALKACMKKGGTEESCAAAAITQANGVLNTNSSYSVYKNKPESDYEVKLAVHQEKPHLIIPVVMMVEGVHNGNMGPLLHTMAELGKVPASWNGIPVVINHPEDDGQAISANDPAVIDKVAVGRVYNTNVEGDRLRAEVWLDEDKLNEISPQTLEEINARVNIEVSIGVFTENDDEEGDWNGEHFIQIARNHRPDHLAILPDAIGACSCADGCGLGVNNDIQIPDNASGKGDVTEPVEGTIIRTRFDNNNLNKEVIMTNECTPCIKKKVDELIANSQGRWTESDREFLQTLTEEHLVKMAPIEKIVEKEVEVQVNVLSDEDKAALAAYKLQRKEAREQMIKDIQANSSKELWPDEALNGMNDDTLKRVLDSVKKEKPGNYSLNGAGSNFNTNAGEIEPMLPIGVDYSQAK